MLFELYLLVYLIFAFQELQNIISGVPPKFYTENISAFVEHHLKPLAQKVKSYVKDTNDFLRKIANLPPLPEDLIFCTIDVVGLYPNIPHDEGLKAVRNALNSREDKTISTESLLELAECVLKTTYSNTILNSLSRYEEQQ